MSDSIFISYAHTDGLFAQVLSFELKTAGFDFWWDDNLKPGENWSEAIDQQLRDALAVIVLMSPDARNSQYVTYEWSFALGAGVPVIAVLIRKMDEIHPRLSSLQYVDLSDSQRPSFTRVISQLVDLQKQREENAKPARVIAPDYEVNALIDRAEEAYRRKNNSRAFEIFEQALNSAGDAIKPEVCAQLAYVLCKRGDLERADDLLNQALALRTGFVEALAVRGYVFSMMARGIKDDKLKSRALLTKATSALLDALTVEPNLLDMDDESWWGTLGGVYRRNEDFRAAIDAYERAVGVTPQSSYPRSNLALLYMIDNQAEKMKQTYRVVELLASTRLQQAPLDYWAHSDLLLAQVALGHRSDAEVSFDRFLVILPQDVMHSVLDSLLDNVKHLITVLSPEEAAQVQPFVDRLQAVTMPKAS